ncbi:MAG: HD domain-containing protein [Nitrospinota bacterium]|nr:HD domain-containing protein [Nitrospinota bacterium]
MNEMLIEKIRQFAESHFADDGSGHDWWHVHRVWNTAKHLADAEGADRTIVEIAALLHDVADWKLNEDESQGLNTIRDLLEGDLPPETIDRICDIISRVSFKGAGVDTPTESLEGQVVQDADRLDALGAVGIARTFAYGGNRGRLIHHPDQPPQMHDSFEAYKKNKGPSTNHFYEKLLLLKDRMNTGTAKKMAEQRHRFMEQYLDHFFKEWDGEL